VDEEAGGWKGRLKALGISRRREGRATRVPDRGKLETGRGGEEIAALFLAKKGLAVLDRNVRFRNAELDLVAEEGETLVFVEVRRRRSGEPGLAAASVTARKRSRVVRAARLWLSRHPREAARPVRFDVVAVEGEPPSVEWIRGAFDSA